VRAAPWGRESGCVRLLGPSTTRRPSVADDVGAKRGASLPTRSLGAIIGRRTTFRTRRRRRCTRPRPWGGQPLCVLPITPTRRCRTKRNGTLGFSLLARLPAGPSRCLCGLPLRAAGVAISSLGRASAVPGQERASGSCCVPEGLGESRHFSGHALGTTPRARPRMGCRCRRADVQPAGQAFPARLAAARATRAPQRATLMSEVVAARRGRIPSARHVQAVVPSDLGTATAQLAGLSWRGPGHASFTAHAYTQRPPTPPAQLQRSRLTAQALHVG
jgi:hypothetical protein